jgi:hypothetical protein
MRRFRVIIEWKGEAGVENELRNTRLAKTLMQELEYVIEGIGPFRVFVETGPEEGKAPSEPVREPHSGRITASAERRRRNLDMSTASLYVAGPDGRMEEHSEYGNAWLFGMAIWQYLINRYLTAYLPKSGFWMGDGEFLSRLWQLSKDPRVPFVEQVCHACTFDRALVRGSERDVVVNCFRSMATLLPRSHLTQMAEMIESLPPEIRAIGWQATSVAESLWWVYPGPEEEGEGHPYNIDRDTGHHWIFDELKGEDDA